MNLSEQNIVLFGATGGIGSALGRQLAAEGCRLTLVARDSDRLNRLANEWGATAAVLDARDSTAVDDCLNSTAAGGTLHGVVNCIGSLCLKPAHLITDQEWAEVLATNLTTSFYILRSAARHMIRSGGGSIVLIASAVAERGMINHEAIAAAKAGIVGLARSAAATYARSQIRVNCVAPGLTRTPLTASLTANEAVLNASAALHPLGRIGEPDEIARAIRWFLSPEQSWITGQVLGVDGGLSSVQAREPARRT